MRLVAISLLLMFTLSPLAQAEEIGKVIAARGATHALDAEGVRRELKRRSMVFDGDTLVTGEDARLQVRFADGTLLALRPASEYRVDSYQYDQAADDENFSTLIKGGFRTITGVISKGNPEAYQVKTPVATIGVRGTNYETALSDNGLDVAAWQGGVEIESQAGKLVIGAGQDFNFATVGTSNTKPEGLLQPPPSMNGPLLDSDSPETASVSETEDGAEAGNAPDAESTGEESSQPAVAESGTEGSPTAAGTQAEGGDTGFAADTGDDVPLASEPESSGGLLLATTDLGSALDTDVTTDTTFTPVEPIGAISDIVDQFAASDERLDPQEWERLLTEGYGGMLVFGGQNSNHIEGGRALAPGGTSDPVFTNTHVEPYDPAFKTAPIDTVYRRGMAPLNGAGVVSVGTEQVYWGIWNGTTTPIDKLTDPNDANHVVAIHEPAFWVVGRPEDPMRNDIGIYSVVDTFHGGGSPGVLTPSDVTQLSMKINFATGAITNGVFDLYKSPDNWVVNFNGFIKGPFVHLNIKQASSLINSLYPIEGDIGGFMVGKGGKALVGGFDFQDTTNSSNHIEGIFILRE